MADAKANEPPDDTGDPTIDAKLNALDDDLNPIEGNDDPFKKEPEDEPDPTDDPETDDEPVTGDDDKDTTDTEDTEPGYTIDEGVEEEEPVKTEVTPEDQYILDNIKDSAITIRGTVGDSKEVKEYKVLSPQQLPRGFHYVDDYEAGIAFTAFNTLEQKANQLQAQYRQEALNKQSAEIIEKEKQADRADIARMQKDGEIELFKAAPDSKGFESDPAVELVQAVLDFKDNLNSAYNEAYSKGAAYRHIGFEEAFYKYQRENPTKGNTKQVKEDQERRDFARRTNRPNAGRNKQERPKVHAGASSRDLDMYIESLDI